VQLPPMQQSKASGRLLLSNFIRQDLNNKKNARQVIGSIGH
jgi:hypothetical protein